MKLIIEGYPYKAELVEKVLQGIDAPRNKDGFVRVYYVGYFYNNAIKDCVFFLPKVVLNANNEVLTEKYSAEELIDVEKCKRMRREDKDFIYGLSVWIYRAVKEFLRLNNDSEIVYQNTYSRIDGSNTKVSNTLIDVILSLIRFNNENKDFVMFTLKNIHSGYNKINWTRTIAKHQPLMQQGSPIYIDVSNKKKNVNFDEELLVIFYSILQYIKEKYGFRTNVDCNYDLLTGATFSRWLRGYGKIRLREIKYKYFSDKALALWKHCYAFFELSELINSSRQQSDYLLVRDFNIVFEAIIDELLSDKDLKKGDLVEQKDGKRVDHMYAYDGLINDNEKIYYIGDSKYYKIGRDVDDKSVYKQYTYARNVIQYNLKLFLNKEGEPGKDYLIYRDPDTEGYNITPNFFISARLNDTYSYTEDDLTARGEHEPVKHFENRLFDRDTLLLQQYDVNFLFVLALYASSNDYAKAEFKKFAQEKFRSKIIDYLEVKYQFFSLQKKPEVSDSMRSVVDRHFREIIGKTFRPYKKDDVLYLSCEMDEKYVNDNLQLLSELSKEFIIRDYKLGTDPRDEINHFTNLVATVHAEGASGGAEHVYSFAELPNETFLFGGFREDGDHLEWIINNNAYNVRSSATRDGSIHKIKPLAMSAFYLFLYNINHPEDGVYAVYEIRQKQMVTKKQMEELGYKAKGDYLLYRDLREIKFQDFDLKLIMEYSRISEMERLRLAGQIKEGWEDRWKGTPLFYKGEEVSKILKKQA